MSSKKTKAKATKDQPKNPRGTFYVEDIPEDLRREFKAMCARSGLPMKQAIHMYMKAAVAGGKLFP